MSTYVVPPFQNVYRTLKENIFDKVLAIDSNSLTTDDNALTSFGSNLYCELEALSKNLDASVAASNNVRVQVNFKLFTLKQEIAAKENEIARMDTQIRDANGKIQAKQTQINAADQSVQQSERLVADAQNALQRAEQEVANAQLCSGLFGRRKRFLGNVWNSIGSAINTAANAVGSAATTAVDAVGSAANTAAGAIGSAANTVADAVVDNVVKPVCSVINFQQVDNARRNVENKKNELASFRNLVQSLRNEFNSLQNDLTINKAQLNNFNSQLNQLKNSLISLPSEEHMIIMIHQKLSDVVTQIRTLFSGSTTFLNALSGVFDSESIVKPLNAVYDELQKNQFMGPFSVGKISIEQINQAQINLQALIVAVPNMLSNMGAVRCSK
ncbi:unnamed protein product [Adineta steineri]|uniref:Uncharacterized protein n=1 Tax=Adineta steineri TaxID=433720 RepID=A0A813TDE9_9BILA|nr:unnamed protein product [Adineta steineri]CAF0848046.1 unnamed protein product [Adineta steineri]CAF0920996.1 unnamed protein product [Adineta steineri]